jgi:Sulfotransferase family
MAKDDFDRRAGWTPKPRPDWIQALNALGDGLDPRHIIPLSPPSLMAAATQATGLSDFGEGPWQQHFSVLIDAIEHEAELHVGGRLLTRYELIHYLQQRLHITEAYRHSPQIDEETIDRPVFITGYARSGTTILFEVLAQDPQFRVAAKWEQLYPCPPPEPATYKTDERIARTERLMAFLDAMTPEHKAAHKAGAELPVEALELEYASFLSEIFPIVFQIPTYAKYQAELGVSEALAWQRKTLKLLQSKHRAKHWLMKSPTHLPHVRTLLDTFPGMRMIFTHRDPVVTADSVVSMMGIIYWQRTDSQWGSGSIDSWPLATASARAKMYDEAIDLIESGVLAKGSYANFQYAEFLRDPIASVRKIYNDLELSLEKDVEEKMLAYLTVKTQGQFGKHQYESTPENVVESERAAYEKYQTFFDVPAEL